jgi:fatty-acyl-CoA synthase
MLANTPAMLEAHYGVPMTGAVLNTLNTRLDAAIPPSRSTMPRPRC